MILTFATILYFTHPKEEINYTDSLQITFDNVYGLLCGRPWREDRSSNATVTQQRRSSDAAAMQQRRSSDAAATQQRRSSDAAAVQQ